MKNSTTQFCKKRHAFAIDSTQLDIHSIDEKTKKVSRPWLTAAVDLDSGLILRTRLSSDRLDGPDLEAFKRFVVDTYGIPEQIRPIHKPYYCGVVERYFSTTNGRLLHQLQGNIANKNELSDLIKDE